MAQTTRPPPPHRQLSRLSIPSVPSSPYNQMHSPVTLDGQPLFLSQSPSAAFHPAVPPHMLAMPVPANMPSSPRLPFAPNPMWGHQSRPSLAGGMIPATPGSAVAGQFPFNGPPRPGFHNRRAQSISLGGPPKAVLGGPKRPDPVQRSVSTTIDAASPAINAVADIAPPTPLPVSELPKPLPSTLPKLTKKVSVKLPSESVHPDSVNAPLWYRYPIRFNAPQNEQAVEPPTISTAEIFDITDPAVPASSSAIQIGIPPPVGLLPLFVRCRVVAEIPFIRAPGRSTKTKS